MTQIFEAWHASAIAALNGRPLAHNFKKKHGIGMEPLIQVDKIARFSSVKSALQAIPAHEFFPTRGTASLYDCMMKAKEAGPLSPVFDDHNNDPTNYHGEGDWEGRPYGSNGRYENGVSIHTWREIIEEIDDLFEPTHGGILNEVAFDDPDYLNLVRSLAYTMRQRGIRPIAQAPGNFPAGTIKGTHLPMLARWTLPRTLEIVDEMLDWKRSLDECWIARGTAWDEHSAHQMMTAVRRSYERARPVLTIFIGDEAYPRHGVKWQGRNMQTFVVSAGQLTTWGRMLDHYLEEKNPQPEPEPEPEPEPTPDPDPVPSAEHDVVLNIMQFADRVSKLDAMQDRERHPSWYAKDPELQRQARELARALRRVE